MDNQHKKIKGYRDLSQGEIDMMNETKELAERVGDLINRLEAINLSTTNHSFDMRWVNIGKTDLQKGFMSLIRGIA